MTQQVHTKTVEKKGNKPSSSSHGTGGANTTAEQDAAKARLSMNAKWIPDPWKQLGKDLFSETLVVAVKPEIEAFRLGAYRLKAELKHELKPMLEMLECTEDRKPYLEALRAVDDIAKADKPHFDAIEKGIKDLEAGGEVAFNTRELLAHYAPLSAMAKSWLGESPMVKVTLGTYLSSGSCHNHGVLEMSWHAKGSIAEKMIVDAAQRYGGIRVDAVRRIEQLLKKGSLGVGPAKQEANAQTEAPKDPEAEAAKKAELEAIEKQTKALTARIKSTVRRGKSKDGVHVVDDDTFLQLKQDLEHADERVRDRIYGDAELMHYLTQAGDARQMQQLVHAVDSVEALYQSCLPHSAEQPKNGIMVQHATKKPFDLVHHYLQQRLGDEHKEARARVLRHAQLKSTVIDPMTDADRRLIYRMITRGTETPTTEDKIHEAAQAGDGVAMAKLLMQLASEDGALLQALKQDQLFWQSVEKLDKDVVVDGFTVNPYSLCLTMWGLEPRSVKDPGAAQLQGNINLTGDNRPLKIEERIKLEEELFLPTIRSLYSEFCEHIVDDKDCVSILRRFEEKALKPEYSDLLHRSKEAPGPALETKYNALHSPLRNELSEYVEGNERRECERIVGVRLESTVGVIGGNVRMQSDKDKGAMPLEQAMRETAHDGKPLTQHISRCVDTFLERTYVPPDLGMGFISPGSGPWGDMEDVLSAWHKWDGIFDAEKKKTISALTGVSASSLHAIELLSNAFRMRGGELGERMNRCFRGRERQRVLTEMGLRAEDIVQRQMAGNSELMKTDPESAISQHADILWKTAAQEIFETIATMKEFDDEHVNALADKLAAASAKGIEPPTDTAAAAKYATVTEEQQPRSFTGYYRKHYGIDVKLHIARVIRAAPNGWALGGIATKLGVDPSLALREIQTPTEALEITDANRHLVTPSFSIARAEALATQIWELIHGSGEVQLVMAQLYGKYTPEEQRLIAIAFRRLSGGIDVGFYVRQEMLRRKEGTTLLGESKVVLIGGEGTAEGKKAVGGKTELNIEGDQTQLETAVSLATTGVIDHRAALTAAVGNRDIPQMFRLVDDCDEAECRKILADNALMTAMFKVCDQYAWDRISKTLTGQSDLMDRLYSRAHGAYDSWNPFDCTDEAGIRDDIKHYVQRLRRKFDKELRANAKGIDPQKLKNDIDQKVRDACQRLMANPNVRGLIEAELSGSELAEAEGLILNAGEDSTKSDVARGGEDADVIIAGIRALTAKQKAPLRNDPAYLEKLAIRLRKPDDYREAIDLLMSDSDGQGALADLGRSTSDDDDRKTMRSLLAMSEAEYRQLAANPALQARILASIGDSKQRAMVRDLLSLRLAEANKDPATADKPEATDSTVAADDASVAGTTAIADPNAAAKKAAAADQQRLDYLRHMAIQRIRFATTLGWDTMLEQCVEVYKLDFAPAPVQGPPATDGTPPPAPDVAMAAAQAASKKARAALWATLKDEVTTFSRKAVKDTRHTLSNVNEADMNRIIKGAILGEKDPSAERLRENLVGYSKVRMLDGQEITVRDPGDNDQKGLLATISAASPQVLINEWTSITQIRPNGAESMKVVYERFSQTEATLAKKLDAAKDKGAKEQDGKPESPITKEEKELYTKQRLEFMNYVPGISDSFERDLIPFVGTENDRTEKSGQARLREDLRVRDNKKYNELLDSVSNRAQSLPRTNTADVATAIGATGAHAQLVDNQNRTTLGQLELREMKYLQQRGTQQNSGWAAHDQAENLDVAMVQYAREAAISQVNIDGPNDAYGMISAGEADKVEEKGKEFDRAHQAFKDAKAKVAMWMSLIIGVLVTCLLTVLTGGAATGFAAMLFWSAVTAGASAAAKAAINEAVLGSDYDFSDEGVKMIGKEMLTAVITAGTTFIAQRMVAGVTGLTTLSRQARGAEQALRVKPPLWKSFLHEGSEEILSETMSGTIEAGLTAINPTHWMHGVVEGQDRALPQAWAQLSAVPGNALRGGVTSIVTAGATRVLGSKKKELNKLADAAKNGKKKINVRENFAEVFGDQREAMIATFTEFAIAKIGGDKFDIENVPGELLEGYLQEMNEKGTEMHTATAHKGRRADRAKSDLKKYDHLLTAQEKADFLAMNKEAEGTDTYITPAEYVGVRHQMAADAIGSWSESSGQQLTADQARNYIMFVRGAKDADELQARLKIDPRVGAAAAAIDGQGPFDPKKRVMYVPDASPETDTTSAVADKARAEAKPDKQRKSKSDQQSEDTQDTKTQVTQQTDIAQATTQTAPRVVAKDFPDLDYMSAMPPTVIAGHQIGRAETALAGMSQEDYNTFQGILASIPGPAAHAFLYKAVAAGNSMGEIQWFAGYLVGKSDEWLVDHLTLGDFNGKGIGVQQQWSMSCNASTTITMRGNYDPVFALQTRLFNSNINQFDANDPTKFNAHLAGMERDLLERAYAGAAFPAYQGMAGEAKVRSDSSQAQGRFADDLLNDQADATGLKFTSRVEPSPQEALATLTQALGQGLQIPVVIGQTKRNHKHYVLCQQSRVNPDTNELEFQFHNTGDGTTSWVSSTQILTGRMGLAGGNMITLMEVPSVVPMATTAASAATTAASTATTQQMPAVTRPAETAASSAKTQQMPAVTRPAETAASSAKTQQMPAVTAPVEIAASSAKTQQMPAVTAPVETAASSAKTQQMPAVTAPVETAASSAKTQQMPAVTAPVETAASSAKTQQMPAVTVETESPGTSQANRTSAQEGMDSINSAGSFEYRLEKVKQIRQDILTGSRFAISPDVSDETLVRMKQHVDKLSDEELAAIQGYSSQDYEVINKVLRDPAADPVKSAAMSGYIGAIKSGLDKLPAFEGEVYRGTAVSQRNWRRIEDAFASGEPYSDLAFSSSSENEPVAEEFLDRGRADGRVPVFFTIQSRNGKQIEFLSKTANETEVLFHAGAKFRISSIEEGIGPDGLPRKEVRMIEMADTANTTEGAPGGAIGAVGHAGPPSDPRSKFRGNQSQTLLTHADAQKAIDGPMPFLPAGATRIKGSNTILLTSASDRDQKMEVTITVGDVAVISVSRGGGTEQVVPAAQYDREAALTPNEPVAVTIAQGARAEDISRALAHELYELQQILEERGQSGEEDSKVALARHDRSGRIGELSVLFARLVPTATANGINNKRAGALVIEIEGVLAELGLSRKSSRTDLEAALGPQLAAQISKLNFLEGYYQAKDQDNSEGGIRIYGHESDLSDGKVSPGHIMGTGTKSDGGTVHSSFAPNVAKNRRPGERVPMSDEKISPFEGATAIKPEVMAGEHRKDPKNDSEAQKGNFDFDHSFSPDFLPNDEFARAVKLAEFADREKQYQIATIDHDAVRGAPPKGQPVVDGTVQAYNCVVDLIDKLRQAHTGYVRIDGDKPVPVMVLEPDDFVMLNLNANGTAKPGADLRTQDLYQHLRWKAAELAANNDRYAKGDARDHLFNPRRLREITPNQIGQVAFGKAPYMDWGAGDNGPAQCDKRMRDLQNDDEVERLAKLGVTFDMADLWAQFYAFETAKNPVKEGERGGNANAPARGKLMRTLAQRLLEIGRRG